MRTMDFEEVIRRQRMVRPPYADRPVPTELVDQILANAQKAPSAGFSQGVAFVVLDTEADTGRFWSLTRPRSEPHERPRAPVVVIPLENAQVYLDRYREPDKVTNGMGDSTDAWPAPFWTIDTAFAAMTVMLSATAVGVGAWFFGIFAGEQALRRDLGVPDDFRAIGAITLGYRSEHERRSPSLARGRKPFDQFVHRGRW
jgi:nitroreductase